VKGDYNGTQDFYMRGTIFSTVATYAKKEGYITRYWNLRTVISASILDSPIDDDNNEQFDLTILVL
jgi:hypothetical protein